MGYQSLDINGCFIDVNRAWLDMLGYDKDEIIGKWFGDFLHPDQKEVFRELFPLNIKSTEIIRGVEFTLKKKDGSFIIVQYTANIGRDKEGNFKQTHCIFQDITKQKKFEEKLIKKEHDLTQLVENLQNREKTVTLLLNSVHDILEIHDFTKTARKVFDSCAKSIGAKAGYVALLSDDGEENELLFLEDGGMKCTVDPELPMPVRGLREQAYNTGKVVYDNSFMNSEWVKFMPEGHMPLKNVLFSPLNINGKTVGIMGFACKKGNFTEDDARIAEAFGEYAAIALNNSNNLEKIKTHENELETLVKERTSELQEKYNEIEEFNRLFVGREFRIKELKDKIKELEGKINHR
ncbi:MAG: PAS domain S-box protein [Prolixibacteraceae bacterium]|nr:PAS domain S-box protein [Prolixibacteraceae bacterium]MBN2773477.1 PAS domain S-box protein [Prolixibacteraceae bacterium]